MKSCQGKETCHLTNKLINIFLSFFNLKHHKVTHLAVKEKWTFNPSSVYFSFTPGWYNLCYNQSHYPLTLLSFLHSKSSPAGRNNQKTERKEVLSSNFLFRLDCKCMCFQTCFTLGHCSQSQKGRVPPIGAQPESSFLSITTYSLSLLPQTHWHSTPTHWLTICFFTHAQRKSQFECTQ